MSDFINKLNKVDGKIYVIEEAVTLINGVYESLLQHDNINKSTLSVYSGSKLTGDKIDSYALSTPGDTPWKHSIRIYADHPIVYISYETEGDTVEAEDINLVQDAVIETQSNLLNETQRAKDKEQLLDEDIKKESQRAETAEKIVSDILDSEIARAKQEEVINAHAISTESTRAIQAEETLESGLNTETARALSIEMNLQNSIDLHTELVHSEINRLNQMDTNLDEKKANVLDVNRELNNRYVKSEVFTKEEVLLKIEDLIGSAPETLDTFKEIAEALGNDPNFAATIMTILSKKVEKVSGKELSSNDFTSDLLVKLNGISDEANNYIHPSAHPSSMITQDANNRFTSDAEKNVWNAHASNKSNPHSVTVTQIGAAASSHNHDAAYIKKGTTWNGIKGV